MSNKKLISKILFIISFVLFVIFTFTVFFGGQKIGGSIYFIFFAVSLAFAFLDRKYNADYMEYYRYARYLDDLINILAVSSLIYYEIYSVYFIAILCLLGVGLFVDLFSKNRQGEKNNVSIVASILNCVLMISIFPFFFFKNLSIVYPIIAIVVATIVDILKILLEVIPKKNKNADNKNVENEVVEQKIIDKDVLKTNSENNVE